MLTAALTAVATAIMSFLGVEPTPGRVGVTFIIIKIAVVAAAAAIAYRMRRKLR